MDLKEFKSTLGEPEPPPRLTPTLRALWYQANGQWDQAHRLAQAQHDATGAWIHAFLHRVEGATGNAAHWYRRAGKPPFSGSSTAEWEEIATALCEARRDP